jgi:gas vesicle protein
MDKQHKSGVHRRAFLNGLIGGLTAGGAIAAGSSLVTSARAGTETDDEKRKSRYRVTDEVKTYYRVNSYPT